jgi:hypothetical protein
MLVLVFKEESTIIKKLDSVNLNGHGSNHPTRENCQKV